MGGFVAICDINNILNNFVFLGYSSIEKRSFIS